MQNLLVKNQLKPQLIAEVPTITNHYAVGNGAGLAILLGEVQMTSPEKRSIAILNAQDDMELLNELGKEDLMKYKMKMKTKGIHS